MRLGQLLSSAASCIVRDTDSPEERRRKRIVFPLVCLIVALIALMAATSSRLRPSHQALFIGTAQAGLVSLGLVIYVAVTGSLPQGALGVWVFLACTAAIIADWSSAARSAVFRPWNWIILGMDLSLAFDVSRAVQKAILPLAGVYLTVVTMGASLPLGLFDTTFTSAGREGARDLCDCSDPPCALPVSWGVSATVCILTVLFGDYIATRSFADGLRSEQATTQRSVRLSEHVAQLLADYGTDEARAVVAQEGRALPVALLAAYNKLLDNLDRYRPFLPDSVLFTDWNGRAELPVELSPASPLSAVSSPAARAPELRDAAVCFTDIQSSSELWETRPLAMYEALRIHNKVMRTAYARVDGYEVKTIGDAFMILFDAARDVVRFGLDVQSALLQQHWPEGLLDHTLCTPVFGPTGALLWKGLRVRVAAHYGTVNVERNPVTGRNDVFGHTVNTAGRMERVLQPGGMLAVTGAVMSQLGELRDLGSPAVVCVGSRQLAGIKELVEVWALVHQVLCRRLDLISCPSPVAHRPDREDGFQCGTSSRGDSDVAPSPHSLRALSLTHSDRVLQRTHASCAVARIALSRSQRVEHSITAFASAVVLAADQTQGVVECALSATAVVSWNASTLCADHAAGCRGFIATVQLVDSHLGAASGALLNGTVATARRSFATVVGGCVELAAALAEEAERCEDEALAVGPVAENLAATGAAHCAQLWSAPCGDTAVVWAVDRARMGDKWGLLQHDTASRRRAEPSAEAVAAVLLCKVCAGMRGADRAAPAEPGSAEQLAALAKGAELLGPDAADAVQCLRDRIRAGLVRTRPMPQLWDIDWGRHHAARAAALTTGS